MVTARDEQLIETLVGIRVYGSQGKRAPYKPLMLLSRLSALLRGEPRLVSFEKLADDVTPLWETFGRPGSAVRPEYPYWRLLNDGTIWEVPERELVIEQGGQNKAGDAKPSVLRALGAQGGFSEPVYAALRKKPELVTHVTASLLARFFSPSIHEDVLETVGMPWLPALHRTRDSANNPAFRDLILRNYEYRCAVCGYDGRMGRNTVGLEAAHVKWHAYGGPDSEDNGLALCVLHHRLLDRGAIGIDEEHRILVSSEIDGSSESVVDVILRFVGQPLRLPRTRKAMVAQPYLRWHQREVFRPPARETP